MAWKFKQEYVRDGDVVEPSEWRININESMSEFNGFLDSDNIKRDAIDVSLIKRETFTAVRSADLNPKWSYIFNHEKSGWIRETEAYINRDVNRTDAYFEPAINTGYLSPAGDDSAFRKFNADQLKLPSSTFFADSDGLLVCEFSGWVDWLSTSSHPDFLDNMKDAGSGEALPRRRAETVYGYFAKQSKYFKAVNALILCSMWRITVNGQSVAETGPLGNEYKTHPIYLCGATPILKGSEVIVQLEARFVWYSPGVDQYVEASAFAPIALGRGATPDEKFTYRRDCSLNVPHLIVTYRKR